jgi:hypothetical protein
LLAYSSNSLDISLLSIAGAAPGMGRLMTAVLVAGPRAFLPPIARALQKPDVGR